MPFFPLIKMPSSASRYSCTWRKSPVQYHISGMSSKGLHDAVNAVLPALDLQQRYHPGWGKSRTQATHIRYSQTAWALQDRSAAEMGPNETTAQNYSRRQLSLTILQQQHWNANNNMQNVSPLWGTDIHPWGSGSSHNVPEMTPKRGYFGQLTEGVHLSECCGCQT